MKPLRQRSIRRQTFVLFLIGAVAPVILIGAVSIVTVQAGLAQQAADDDRAITETGASLVADKMDDFVSGVELLASNPSLRSAAIEAATNGSAAALQSALDLVAQEQSVFSAITITNGTQSLVAGWPASATWMEEADLGMQTFLQAYGTETATFISGLFEPQPGVRLVPTTTVLRDDREALVGVLVGFAPSSVFDPLILPLAQGEKDVLLFDGSKEVIAGIADESRDSAARGTAVNQARDAGEQSIRSGSIRTGGENSQVAAYAPVQVASAKWVLVTVQPLSAVYSQTASVFYISLATVALTGVVAAVLARSLARRTVEPVVELTGATRDLRIAEALPAALLERPDELGNLARSFQQMAEQVRAESEAKEELIGRLKEVDHLKTTIIDTVSHELRTPITIIRGTAELMESSDSGADGRTARSSGRIVQAADQLAYLVDELLEMSQIQAGVAALSRTPVDINQVVQEAVRLEESAARRQGVTLALELDDELAPVTADRPKMRIMVRNLVSNAVKFSRRDGKVTVTTGRKDGGVFVRVRDEGIGISKGAMEHIFDPFFQADGSSTRVHGGAGIGLAVARNLATMHGGSITAESEAGKGSTFTVTVPTGGAKPA